MIGVRAQARQSPWNSRSIRRGWPGAGHPHPGTNERKRARRAEQDTPPRLSLAADRTRRKITGTSRKSRRQAIRATAAVSESDKNTSTRFGAANERLYLRLRHEQMQASENARDADEGEGTINKKTGLGETCTSVNPFAIVSGSSQMSIWDGPE